MKISNPRLWIALLSASAVLLIGLVDMDRTSPGPISAVHGRVEDLAGGNSCSECHGGWFSGMTESCADCHERIEQQIVERTGLHGRLERSLADQCGKCHTEHHGESFALINRRTFALAGVPDPQDFDHDMVGFEMLGRHLELECTKCHVHAADEVLPEGAMRYGGLSPSCVTCHEDVHKGQFDLACTACHGQQSFTELHSQGHERHLPLIGGHGDRNCRDCHALDSKHALEIVGSTAEAPAARECAECHESPHQTSFTNQVAALVTMREPASCVVCHVAEHTEFAEAETTTTVEQHARSGFALAEPHHEAKCEDCHAPELETFAERYPGRGADECSSCHEDPHAGQFDETFIAVGDCISCHARTNFAPHTFDVNAHAKTAFPLEGVHARTDCAECHVDPPEGVARQFRGTASLCQDCHRDAHAGYFRSRTAELEPHPHGDCARCHDAQAFRFADPTSFDHAEWTGFPVRGAHAETDCTVCHPRSETCDSAGRTFGRVSEHFGEFTGCVTCHADPHQGRFDDPSKPTSVAGRTDCARCHVETSFRAFPKSFEHGRWTDFTLIGPHAEAKCSACHPPLSKPDENGRTWENAIGSQCADCHDDPHAGQFEEQGETDCARCHVEHRPKYLSFDHDRDSRFPLRETHAQVACAACHRTETADGEEFVRYRPLGVECADCHGAEGDVLLRRKPRRK